MLIFDSFVFGLYRYPLGEAVLTYGQLVLTNGQPIT